MRSLICLVLTAAALLNPDAMAQHDDCSQATPIAGEGNFPFTTLGTTQSGLLVSCFNGPNPDAWFVWTPALSGSYVISSCDNADFRVIYAVRDGGCGGPELMCEYNACPRGTAGSFDNEGLVGPLTAGTPYWIQITGAQGSTGSGVLEITHISFDELGADDCEDATPIVGLGTWIWNAWTATPGPFPEPFCNLMGTQTLFTGDDVWFAWTAPSTGFFQIDGCTIGSGYPAIVLYRGHDCPPPPAIGCTDDFCRGGIIRTQATAGEPFLIRVGFRDRGQVNISEVIPLPNDECAGAEPISGVGMFPFDTLGASDSEERPSCATSGFLDIWFEWTSAGAATYRFDRAGSANGLAIYDSSCAGTEIACTDGFPSGFPFDVDLPAGATFILQLIATTSEGPGDLIIESFDSPPSDECADAIVIPFLGPQTFDTTGATTDGPSNQGCGSIFRDVWFEWTAPTSDYYELRLCDPTFNARMELFEGVTCPPGPPVACTITVPSCTSGSAFRLFTTAGQDYLLRVGAWSESHLQEGTGTIDISTFVPPANDELAGATLLPHDEGLFPFSTLDAALSPDPLSSSCPGLGFVDVWFTWSPPENFAFWRFSAPGSGTRIAIYNASTFEQLECGNNLANGGMNFFTDYLIRICTTSALQGSLLIDRYHPAGGFTNDECVDARSIYGLGAFEFNNLLATTEPPPNDPTCTSLPVRTLWYDWTAPTSSTFRAETCALTGINTILAVYDGNSCPTTQSIDCNDNACGHQSRIEWSATEGQHYLLLVGSQVGANPGFGLFRITDLEATGVGTVYCAAVPTSSGEPAQITAAGSTSIAANALGLTATGLPPSVFGLFFFGANQLNVPLGDGTACVGGQVFRLPIRAADASGTLQQPDFWALSNSAFVMPGSTWNFQAWFRDAPAGMSGFNLSNAVSLSFTP